MNPYESESAQYMRAVAAAVSANQDLMVTDECADCDQSVMGENFVNAWHTCTAYRGRVVVVIGCDGYHHIDPASVGMPAMNWHGIPGVNMPANVEPDEK